MTRRSRNRNGSKDVFQISYLSEDISSMVVEELGQEIANVFAGVEELDNVLIETYAEEMSDELFEALTSSIEKETPKEETDKRSARRNRREETKSDSSNAPKRVTRAQKMEEEGALIIDSINQLFEAMDINSAIVVTRPGKNKWALQPISAAALPIKGKGKKVSNTKFFNSLKSEEYIEFLKEMNEKYPTREDRVAYAEEMGLVRGQDWQCTRKEDGQEFDASTERMYISKAIRAKLGIKKYIEGMNDSKVRHAAAKEYHAQQV